MGKRVEHDLLTYPQPDPMNVSGHIPTWNVASSYVVADGRLCRVGSSQTVKCYNPFAEYDLPTQLARMGTGELSAVEFASQFGLLGHDRLLSRVMNTRASAGNAKAIQYLKRPVTPEGDPLKWVLLHSQTVAFCLELIGALSEGDPLVIADVVEGARSGPYACGLGEIRFPAEFTRQTLAVHAGNANRHAPIARRWLGHLITENIAGIRRRVLSDAYGTHLNSMFSFVAMIETVYWQIADKAEGGWVRRCLECKRFFITRDKRQQYCPPFPGSTRSRCSSRLNTGNLRLREKLNGK